MAQLAAKRYIVTGFVQGVGFRYFVEREANALGIAGWVRNRDDGSVEVEASGAVAKLAELEGRLWKGPRMAEVRGVASTEIAPGAWTSFRIR